MKNHCSQSHERESELPTSQYLCESDHTAKNLESPSLVFYVEDSELEERSPAKEPSWQLGMNERREAGRLQVMSNI